MSGSNSPAYGDVAAVAAYLGVSDRAVRRMLADGLRHVKFGDSQQAGVTSSCTEPFLAFTGLRVGECAGLNIADVDTHNRKVTVRRTRSKGKGGWEIGTPKSGKSRTAPLPKKLARDLAAYLDQHPRADEPDAPFWPGRAITGRSRHGNSSSLDYTAPWNPGPFFRNIFKPTVKATKGIPDALRQHDLRHTFASICASNGIPAAQVAAWMGHGNEVVTRTIYTHLFAEDTTAHEAALDAAFGVGGADNVIPLHKPA